jgi:hypothetical protein
LLLCSEFPRVVLLSHVIQRANEFPRLVKDIRHQLVIPLDGLLVMERDLQPCDLRASGLREKPCHDRADRATG